MSSIPTLKDAVPLRGQAYINGAWSGAESGFAVTNPVWEGSKYGMDEYQELKYLCMGGI